MLGATFSGAGPTCPNLSQSPEYPLTPQKMASPERFATNIRGPAGFIPVPLPSYFGITSRANLLATTSRISLRFVAASIMASREP